MRILPAVLLVLSACATNNEVRTEPSCPIAEFSWSASDQGGLFDKAYTLDAVRALREAASADRQAWIAQQPVGTQVNDIARASHSSRIISFEANQLAQRLRQLDCAVSHGFYANRRDSAARLYTQILDDLGWHEVAVVNAGMKRF
jgi:hypothetical protein